MHTKTALPKFSRTCCRPQKAIPILKYLHRDLLSFISCTEFIKLFHISLHVKTNNWQILAGQSVGFAWIPQPVSVHLQMIKNTCCASVHCINITLQRLPSVATRRFSSVHSTGTIYVPQPTAPTCSVFWNPQQTRRASLRSAWNSCT